MAIWTTKKLAECVSFRTGKLNSSAAEKNGVYPFFTCSQEIYRINTWSFDTECVLLGGNNASAIYPIFYYNGKFDAYQRTYIIEPKDNFNIRFFYYLISKKLDELKKKSTGAATKFLTIKILHNIEVSVPEIEEQEYIASILSAYDDLIENNEKRIKALEEIAQLLYTEWFVKFKFPGHEKVRMVDSGTEYGMIPEGWEIRNVASLIKRIPVGKKYENKSVSETGKVPVLDQGKSGFIGFHNDEPGVKASVEKPVIIFANHTCYQNIIVYPFSAIQNVLPFTPNDERDIFWLHWATKDLIKFNDYKGHWPEFMAKKLIVAPVDATKKFGALVSKYVAMKYELETENNNLSKTRDLLIPQLITGKRELR